MAKHLSGERIRHIAAQISSKGRVAPLCAPTRPINLKRDSWVLAADRASCPACISSAGQ